MKVPTKTSTEDVKITNVFGDEYVPEEYEFICDDCLAEEVESLDEDVVGLAKDILDHDKILDLYAERIYSVEEACFGADGEGGLKKCVEELKDNQLQDVENLSSVIDIIGCIQEANKMMLEIIMDQDRWIRKLDKLSAIWAVVVFVWLAVLTVLFGIYVF